MNVTKRILLACFIMILVFVLTSCSAKDDGPQITAREWVEATVTLDGATAKKLTCLQSRDEVQMSGFFLAALMTLGGVDPQNVDVDMSELEFTTTEQTDVAAVVSVSGNIYFSIFGAPTQDYLDMDLYLIKEDGNWKVCGDNQISRAKLDDVTEDVTENLEDGKHKTVSSIEWKYATIPDNLNLNSVVNAGDKFVTVGYGDDPMAGRGIRPLGIILTSSDENGPWIPAYIDAENVLNGVAWSGEQIVAVGNNGAVYVSSDGLGWTFYDTGTTRNLYDIIWADGQYIAVGEYGAKITSKDGIKWDIRPVVVESDLKRILHNGSLYVAVGHEGAIVTSTDGDVWNVQDSGVLNNLKNIIWDGNHFLSVSGRGGRAHEPVVIKSPDGVIWDVQPFPFRKNDIDGLTWANNTYIAVSQPGHGPPGSAFTSQDGITWNNIEDTTGSYRDIYWTGDNFVAVGDGTYDISPDGYKWNSKVLYGRILTGITGAAWSGNRYVATMNDRFIWTSENIIDWQKHDPEPEARLNLYDAAWSGERFVVVGDSGEIFTSGDGLEWTPRISGTNMQIFSVIWAGEQFVAVGNSRSYGDDMTILTSPDGISWSVRSSGTTKSINDVAWSGHKLIAVGHEGTILTSSDGGKWNQLESPTSRKLQSVALGADRYVAVGNDIIISENGVDWEMSNFPADSSDTLNSVIWTGSQFIAVGNKGTTLISTDGMEWEQMPKRTRNNLYDLVLTDEGILATGSRAMIFWAE